MISYQPIPILFKTDYFSIYTYGIVTALAFVIVLFFSIKRLEKLKEKYKDIEKEKVYGLIISMALSSLVFSRVFYVLYNYNSFSSVLDVFKIWKGGLFGIGALIGGVFGIIVYAKAKKLDFLKTADFIVPSAVLAFAIIRIGCFLRGCCFGLPTNLPWGILYSSGSLAAQAGFAVPLHPTQLYHSLANFIIFFILIRSEKGAERKKGFVFLLALVLFSVQRFLIDFLRYYPEENYISFMGINASVFQIGYFAIFLFSLVFLLSLESQKQTIKYK